MDAKQVGKRILLVSASIGGGHVAAARALETSFKGEGVQVTHIDLLDYTSLPFRRFYRQAYFDLVRTAPEFVDWLGTRLDRHPSETQSRQRKLRARATRLISYHLPRLIKRYSPDAIVHTHFLAPEILSTKLMPDLLRLGSEKRIPQYVVITDFFAHSLWIQPNVEKYFVATEEISVHLQSLGIEDTRVCISGIPINPVFQKLEAKTLARQMLGYHPDKDLLLFMASGLDYRTLEPLIKQLRQLKWPLMTVIVCGRSAELEARLGNLVAGANELVQFEVMGYRDDIPRLMAAADLFVGKPGGLTTSEALAASLPFAIVQPYPLQEEANTNYLLEIGAAFRIEPSSTFNYKLKRFFETHELRQQMTQAARQHSRPEAAHIITETVLNDALNQFK
ncbi:MAG: glycosyltransferase [Trueperaceae bacterium]|nr:glycosyltransferase [Trueperaceae bacterium]